MFCDIMHIPNVGLIVACPAPRKGRGQSDTQDYLQHDSRKGRGREVAWNDKRQEGTN